MKPFFEPSDFNRCDFNSTFDSQTMRIMAEAANAKLEREAKVAYGRMDTKQFLIRDEAGGILSHKALLINIEEIKDQQRETTEQEKKDILAIAEKIKKLYGNSMIGSGHLIKEIREYWMSKANTCDHPAEKVSLFVADPEERPLSPTHFLCQCGTMVKVKQDGFEEIK